MGYEELMRKSELCLSAAQKTKGVMQQIWLAKAQTLKQLALLTRVDV